MPGPWEKYGMPAPAPGPWAKYAAPKSAPVTAMPTGDQMADTTAKGLGGIGALLGTAAPFVAASAEGAPLLPVGVALGTAGLAGYGAKKVLDAAGTTQMLNNAADKLEGPEGPYHAYQESDVKHPIIGGTAANMIADLGSATRPAALAGEALRAIPEGASALAGGIAAPLAEAGYSGLGRLLAGPKKVSDAETGNALLQALNSTHGTPNPPVSDTGQFRAAMLEGKNALGKPVEAARQAAYDAAAVPADLPGYFNQAVGEGLTKGGNANGMMGKFNPLFSRSPSASQDILSTASAATPEMNSLEKARAIQGQFSDQAAKLRQQLQGLSPGKVKSPEADVYGNVAGSIDNAIKSLIPSEQRQALEKANSPYSAFEDMRQMLQKANSGGQVSASKAKALWDTKTPKQKAKMDPEGYFDKIFKTQDPGLIQKLWSGITSIPKAGLAKTIGYGNGLGSLLSEPVSPRFQLNAPIPPNAPAAPLAVSGGIAGLLGGR